MAWMAAVWHLIGVLAGVGPTGPLVGSGALVGSGVLVGVGGLLIVLLAFRALLGKATAAPATRRVLRERIRRVGIPRHRDPDASGRARPRAPTAVRAAA